MDGAKVWSLIFEGWSKRPRWVGWCSWRRLVLLILVRKFRFMMVTAAISGDWPELGMYVGSRGFLQGVCVVFILNAILCW